MLQHSCSTPDRRWGRFLAGVALLAVLWLGLLPWISRQPAVRARLDEQRAAGVDGGAIYYTELPLMDDLLRQLERFHQEHPQALWQPSSSAAGEE